MYLTRTAIYGHNELRKSFALLTCTHFGYMQVGADQTASYVDPLKEGVTSRESRGD